MKYKKLKIAHICEGFIGGISTYLETVLPELIKRDFDVTLICSLGRCRPNALDVIAKLRQQGVMVYTIPMSEQINPLRDIWSFIILFSIFLWEPFDIVHTHCSKAGALGRVSALLAGIQIRLHTPHCFTFMRRKNKFKKLLYILVERILGMVTTKLIAVSTSEAATAITLHIVPRLRCTVVNNPIDTRRVASEQYISEKSKTAIKQSLGINGETSVVSMACRLIEHKGITRFLETSRISNHGNTVFLIAGDGKMRTRIRKCIASQLYDKVRLLGYVSDINKVYVISDVVVLCSDAEGQPYSLLEAMMAKCPIVATFVPGIKDLILHQKTGYLVDCNPINIACAIDFLLDNKALCERYAENAHAFLLKHHNLKQQIIHLTDVYAECEWMYKQRIYATTN